MSVKQKSADWLAAGWAGWNRFWFEPRDPATLGAIRILAGAMLFYTHLVWTLDFAQFFGPNAWVNYDIAAQLQGDPFAWSHFWVVRSMTALWAINIAALVIFAMLTVGLFTRVTAVLAWLFAVSYSHRAIGALFGLDQINIALAMYLMVGPCGAAYSIDRLLAARKAGKPLPPAPPSVGANIATRLLQLHMCVIYLFAGLAKLQGPAWWNGTAMWGAVANMEYQTYDLTWLVHYPVLVAALTHVTIFWEVYYCALIWPRWTRPVMLLLAVPVHLGIAFCMGMITFGFAMLYGNMAFVSPDLVRKLLSRGQAPATSAK